MRRTACVAAVLLALIAYPHATSVLFGIEPGKSTRTEAEKKFDAPIATIDAHTFAYHGQGDASAIRIEYRDPDIVERIRLEFSPALPHADVTRVLGLPAQADATATDPSGSAVEYFGGSRTLALTLARQPAGGVAFVDYCSRELFDRLTAPLAITTKTSDAVRLSNAKDAPVIKEFNPNACRDLFSWAQAEEQAARKAKAVTRRQKAMDIAITAQQGDCAKAATLAETYRKTYAR
jgi:hypothetical protein